MLRNIKTGMNYNHNKINNDNGLLSITITITSVFVCFEKTRSDLFFRQMESMVIRLQRIDSLFLCIRSNPYLIYQVLLTEVCNLDSLHRLHKLLVNIVYFGIVNVQCGLKFLDLYKSLLLSSQEFFVIFTLKRCSLIFDFS